MSRTRASAVVAAALTALLVSVGAALGAARTEGRGDSSPHLLVVPGTPEGAAALAASSGRVVARYESFTLVEASGDDVTRLHRAGADVRDDMRAVEIQGRGVDPAVQRHSFAAGTRKGRSVRNQGDALALVQFVGPVKDAWLARLRKTGVRVVTYVAQNGYLVHASGAQLGRLATFQGRDPAVRAVTRLTAADKIARGVDPVGQQTLAVQTLAGTDGAEARRAVTRDARVVRKGPRVGAFHTQIVRADAADVRRLAADPAILSVQPYVTPRLLDERHAQVVAGNLNSGGTGPSGAGYLAWLGANGFSTTSTFDFAVDVTDEGIDTGVMPPPTGSHPDFYEQGSSSNASRLAYAQEDMASPLPSDADARDCGGHGTNVASIATGYNDVTGTSNGQNDADGYNYGLGVAPMVKVGASRIFNCAGNFDVQGDSSGFYTPLVSGAYAGGARVSNNSWGAAVAGAYTADAQEYDARVRDARPGVSGNQEIVEIFAAGNSGPSRRTVGSPASAKNVITVGASEGPRQIGSSDGCGVPDTGANDVRDIIDFSSRGPTADGRIKPDIVAPGTHVAGASPQTTEYQIAVQPGGVCNKQFPSGNSFYSLVSGTSQATPEATGMTALVRDWYRRTVGSGTQPPSPAMTKAIMVNTATDVKDGRDGAGGTNGNVPDMNQGWGRINMGTVLDATTRQYRDQRAVDVLAASGAEFRQTYGVQSTSKPVKVTLAWTDAPGPTMGASHVNDLDLVIDAGGTTYKGNVFAGGASVPFGTADSRNNVENVYLPPGVDGPFTVRVVGRNIAGDGLPGNSDTTDQDFALVVSNASETTAAVLSAGSTSVASTGDGDAVVEPGESIALDQPIRNVGNAAASAINGTLSSAQSTVSITQAGSGYPDLAAGATGANATRFGLQLGSGHTCGGDVILALGLTSDQSSYPVPIRIETGTPGSPVTRSSGDVPKTIPIDPNSNEVTVTSTLNVAEAGVIRDVDVRISRINHTWVGDLRIAITAPDGTTVVLTDQPGGPTNDGDNLDGTVVDDEASQRLADGAAPYTGRFRPDDDQLSRLDGKEQQGIWKLRVTDVFPSANETTSDAGSIEGWGHDIRRAECSVAAPPPPPPPSGGGSTGGSTGGPSGGGSTAPPPASVPAPSPAPSARLAFPRRQTVRSLLRKGFVSRVAVRGACPCTVSQKLVVSARDVRKLRLASTAARRRKRVRAVVIGRTTKRLSRPGTAALKVKVSRQTKSRLRGVRRLRLSVRTTVTDRTGRKRSSSKRLTLKR